MKAKQTYAFFRQTNSPIASSQMSFFKRFFSRHFNFVFWSRNFILQHFNFAIELKKVFGGILIWQISDFNCETRKMSCLKVHEKYHPAFVSISLQSSRIPPCWNETKSIAGSYNKRNNNSWPLLNNSVHYSVQTLA